MTCAIDVLWNPSRAKQRPAAPRTCSRRARRGASVAGGTGRREAARGLGGAGGPAARKAPPGGAEELLAAGEAVGFGYAGHRPTVTNARSGEGGSRVCDRWRPTVGPGPGGPARARG